MCETRFFRIGSKGGLTRVGTVAEALRHGRNGEFAWLDFTEPTREALSELIEPLGLHPLSIEDCTDTNQVPKVEDFPGNTFILFNFLTHDGDGLKVDEIDLFIGERFLVTVSGFGSNGRRPLQNIDAIVGRNVESARSGPAYLMHAILDYVVDQKFVAVEALEERIDSAEERMLANPARFDATEMLHIRRDLLALRKSLFNEREILVKICRRDCRYIPEQAIYDYRDIYDHLAKFFELTEAYRDMVTSLMELHASMLNNVMALASNQMNSTVRRLTFITTIFMPLTLLSGIGGMSEWSMMTGPENWRLSYPLFLLGMAVIGVFSYFLLKRLDR